MSGPLRRKSTSDILESKPELTLAQAATLLTSNPIPLSTLAAKMYLPISPPPSSTSDSCEECNCFLINCPDFRRLLVSFVPADALLAMTLLDKKWRKTAKNFIDDGVESGEIIPHRGIDCNYNLVKTDRRKLVTSVIFMQNITQIGKDALCWSVNLLSVHIPEGVKCIQSHAFCTCASLNTIEIPKSLKYIGSQAFYQCTSLENFNVLHTDLQHIGDEAFSYCYQLKEMKLPETAWSFGRNVFTYCSNLVSSYIDVDNEDHFHDVTEEVVEYLRSQQRITDVIDLKRVVVKRDREVTELKAKISEMEIAMLKKEIAEVSSCLLSDAKITTLEVILKSNVAQTKFEAFQSEVKVLQTEAKAKEIEINSLKESAALKSNVKAAQSEIKAFKSDHQVENEKRRAGSNEEHTMRFGPAIFSL
ncbi:hypothetical protein TrLO_g2860 [Triparma laevis f. longispina]|uniref:Uncharacterized protein n=1 Tax=Triparma laevis f. longispina TaxID=1714387 RepID=A0A9W7CF65_9STRA|nr:hypothetical protein TrLO_g2860 [Triparma laevis f. longispina]